MDARWGKTGAIAGIVFAVLFVLGLMLPALPGAGESEATVLDFYADSGNRATVIISSYLMGLAGVTFLVFLSSLYRGLRAAEGESGNLATIALGGGIVFVAMAFNSASAWGNVPGGVEFGGEAVPGYEIPIWFTQLGYGNMLLYGMLSAIAMIVSVSLLAQRTALFPRWLAITGFACSFILLFGVMFLPSLALPIWAIATSVAMLKAPASHPREVAQPARAGMAG